MPNKRLVVLMILAIAVIAIFSSGCIEKTEKAVEGWANNVSETILLLIYLWVSMFFIGFFMAGLFLIRAGLDTVRMTLSRRSMDEYHKYIEEDDADGKIISDVWRGPTGYDETDNMNDEAIPLSFQGAIGIGCLIFGVLVSGFCWFILNHIWKYITDLSILKPILPYIINLT